MEWNSVIEGAIAGTIAGMVFAALRYSKGKWDDWCLMRLVTEALRDVNIGHGIGGFSTSIENQLCVDLNIRLIRLNFCAQNGASYAFDFIPEGHGCSTRVTLKPLERQKFIIPAELMPEMLKHDFSFMEIEVDYRRYRGVPFKQHILCRDKFSLIKKIIDSYRDEAAQRGLNQTRVAFRRPPVAFRGDDAG